MLRQLTLTVMTALFIQHVLIYIIVYMIQFVCFNLRYDIIWSSKFDASKG